MRLTLPVAFGLALFACGTDSGPQWVPNFHPGPAMPGYDRYITPTIKDIKPGDNVEYCQWVAAASDTDQDVLDVTGYQSPTGHHAVLYATTETNFKVGESHICTTDDMVSISFLGGVFGEGVSGNSAKLPDGLNFRLPAGHALMANTHWLNATDTTVDGQAVIDLKFAPASDTRVVADLFANNGDTFQIPAGQPTAFDNNCVLQSDMNFAMVTNHMHTYGTSIYSELIHTDGTKEMIRNDTSWSPEWQFDPQYTRFSVAQPFVAHAGDTVHTHCEWTNTTSKDLVFPDEMCDGIGFYFPGHGQITCEDGTYLH